MLAGLIAAAIGWGIAAILRATVLHGPISFWKAFGIGAVVMVPLLAAIPDSSFAPIIGGALMVTLWQGYTGKSRKRADTVHTPSVEKPTLKPVEEHKDQEPVKKEKSQMSKAHDDEKFFEQVADELEEGSRKKGLWLKAETKAGGDKDKARLLYIEWRVEQLSDEEREAQRQKEEAELEARQKAAAEAKAAAVAKAEDAKWWH